MAETLRLPGLIDAHVHLREPGGTAKEDAFSGTAAALAGGFVGILEMPNTAPPTVTREAFLAKASLYRSRAVCDYCLFLGDGGDPATRAAWPRLARHAAGLKLYLDQTYGDLTIGQHGDLERLLRPILEQWPGPGPIALHAESATIRAALEIARNQSAPRPRLHICHVPHPDDLLAIEDARQAGVEVTCEVTPHHLLLAAEKAPPLGGFRQMKPPLLPERIARNFWERLRLVDVIATDHAPHTLEEKTSAAPPPGVPGLETLLPLMLLAVDQGRLTLERLISLTHDGPLRVYGLRAPKASVEVTLGRPYTFTFRGYRTRSDWTPFVGVPALGRVERVTLRGKVVWEDGRLLAAPGDGHRLVHSRLA